MEKAPNHILQNVYNKLTYQRTLQKHKSFKTSKRNTSELYPVWITGMFRSGTTILVKVLIELGLDLGPSTDLLEANGERAKLNPEGFYENYLLMEWSLHIFNKLNSWGDQPPLMIAVDEFDNKSIDYRAFLYDAIVNHHDDRISNHNKTRLLSEYHPGNLNEYFQTKFQTVFGVKNPHFMLLAPVLDDLFSNGKYVIIFRNPNDTIESAKQVSPRVNLELWFDYYSRMIDHPSVVFVDFEMLIKAPEKSLIELSKRLSLSPDISKALKLIDVRKVTSYSQVILPDHIKTLWNKLKLKSINSRI